MTETPTLAGDTFARQYPLALIALGAHTLKHGLAPLTAIDVVDQTVDNWAPRLAVRLPALQEQQDAWVRSVHVDAIVSEPGVCDGWRCSWLVRLPDLGFQITLVGWRAQAVQMVKRVSA